MPWFISNSELVDTLADIASDPEKLAQFKASPEEYLRRSTNLDEATVQALISDDHATVLEAMMSKVEDGENEES